MHLTNIAQLGFVSSCIVFFHLTLKYISSTSFKVNVDNRRYVLFVAFHRHLFFSSYICYCLVCFSFVFLLRFDLFVCLCF